MPPFVTSAINPHTAHFEFAGPVLGPVGIFVGLPLVTWTLAVYFPLFQTSLPPLPTWSTISDSFSFYACLAYAAWFVGLLLLHIVIPGQIVKGVVLRDGSRLSYKINGWRCFLLTHLLLIPVHFFVTPLTKIYDFWPQLVTAMILFSLLGSFVLYAASFSNPKLLLAAGGNSGHIIYDFFIGRELNPRSYIFGTEIDWKMFCELRPGLWLWSVANIAFALKQHEIQGTVDAGMALVLALQALYVIDSIYNEALILTTMDITDDGFGFMLCFGDLAWVPAVYTLQARFLAENPQKLSWPYAAMCFCVAITGFYVFRAANAQKDTFRNMPDDLSVRNLPYIRTKTGSRLLTGGWWGMSRHMNYLGDWLLAVGMSLPTGFATPITYFYPVYFAVLLMHRERRDHHKCSLKYGEEWLQYCRTVKFRIVPFIY